MESIEEFTRKPADCVKLLLEAIRLGGEPAYLTKSHEIFWEMVKELKEMA